MMINALPRLFNSFSRFVFQEDCRLDVNAAPGLITILDQALYRSVEGEITATICASHALLACWLDLKHQAQATLATRLPQKLEVFARTCLEASCDAIEKLSTDKLAQSANLSDPYEPSGLFSSTGILSGHLSILDSLEDTGRRLPKAQRSQDCWETSRLICPDHVWADDVYLTCQRILRHLSKGLPTNVPGEYWSNDVQLLQYLVQQDLPIRLHQFRAAVETNSSVTKRLYLVKCEYRAPFRAFLEAHQTVQRAPSLELVESYISGEETKSENPLQPLLDKPELVEALALEEQLEGLETNMAQAIYGFTELARFLDHKRARLKAVSRILDEDDLRALQNLIRRLKGCNCRKSGPETSTGIRPLLLDLQGVPRDEDGSRDTQKTSVRIKIFLQQLNTLGQLCQTKNAFVLEKRGDLELPSSVIKECTKFDGELWEAYCEDWLELVARQHVLAKDFSNLQDLIRKAEMAISIKAASKQALEVVRQRLDQFSQDRQKRFEVLKEMVEEVCWREMNLRVQILEPAKDRVLKLPSTSVLGLLGRPLQMAGERLPIG